MSGSTADAVTPNPVVDSMTVKPRWSLSSAASSSESLSSASLATAATVGTLDADFPALVDEAGLISPLGASWSLDWWIGGDDRWYFPSSEPTVRQRRLGSGPVIETSMRIPSGDAVATVYGTRSPSQGGHASDVVVVEVTNRSPVPVAVVMAIRPYPSSNGAAVELAENNESLAIKPINSTTVAINDLMLLLPRPAGGAISSSDGDIVDAIEHGAALEGLDPVSGATATAAVMFPLPHSTTLRFVVADRPVETDRLPDSESVAKGWGAVIDGGARFSTPDDGVDHLLGAARARLLMGTADVYDEIDHVIDGAPGADTKGLLGRLRKQPISDAESCNGGAGDILAALAHCGHWDAVERALTHLADTAVIRCESSSTGSRLVAGASVAAALWLADNADGTHDTAYGTVYDTAQQLLEPLSGLTTQVAKLADRGGNGDAADASTAFAGLGLLCGALGQTEAAQDLRGRLADWHPEGDPALAAWRLDGLAPLVERGQQASEACIWPEPDMGCRIPRTMSGVDSAAGAARYANGARSLLVAEDLSGSIDLLPGFPTAWRGGAVEVHEIPTLYGRLSFAIRWHGARPALLWELSSVPSVGTSDAVILRCSSLDPDWSTTAASGETLLAGTQAGLADAPGPGDSFS